MFEDFEILKNTYLFCSFLSQGHVTLEKSPTFTGHSVTICKMGRERTDLMLSKVSPFFNFAVKVQTATVCELFCWFCYVQEAGVLNSCLCASLPFLFIFITSEGHMEWGEKQRKEHKAGQEGERSRTLPGVHVLRSQRKKGEASQVLQA